MAVCHCEHPIIRCDEFGCRCDMCGGYPDLPFEDEADPPTAPALTVSTRPVGEALADDYTAEEVAAMRAEADAFRQPAPPPIPVRARFYICECEHCGWVGSSEQCGTDQGPWGDSDVHCPVCCRAMLADEPSEADIAKHGEAVMQRILAAERQRDADAAETAALRQRLAEVERDLSLALVGDDEKASLRASYYNKAINRARPAEDRALSAEAEQKAAEASNDALMEKLSALAPHGSCACSYDKPGDVCGHHSPALTAAEARSTADQAEIARLRAENDKLRGMLANSGGQCPYCDLPKAEWAKCAAGFPGCGRHDDAMICPNVGAWLDRQALIDALEEALAPFVAVADRLHPETPDEMAVFTAHGRALTHGHFRAARSALSTTTTGGADV